MQSRKNEELSGPTVRDFFPSSLTLASSLPPPPAVVVGDQFIRHTDGDPVNPDPVHLRGS